MSFNTAKHVAHVKKKKKEHTPKSTYDKQREEETIRNATKRGYLRRMTKEFLSSNIGLGDCDLWTVGYLNVSALQLSALDALEMFVNLRICILPGNYITDFSALGNCVNLWMLDLHSNQIRKIPEHKFWAKLNKLEIVLLHDNGISKLDTIHHLSSSPSLLILTLYDTPLSLKNNYRHHVVNRIWSLKVLDHHVISDEEIIENVQTGGPFSAMHKNFRIDLNHYLKKESSLEEAVKCVEELLSRVNKIQAKCSPVLIIQKMFRGYLVRKRFKYVMETRIWAAKSIQRFYRFYKGITKYRDSMLQPPCSPCFPSPIGLLHDRESLDESGRTAVQEMVSAEFIGKESYRANVDADEKRIKVKRRMTIDLVKLESTALEAIQSATQEVVNTYGLGLDSKANASGRREKVRKHSRGKVGASENQKKERNFSEKNEMIEDVEDPLKKRRLKPEKVGKYRTVRVFLGPILESKPKEQDEDIDDDDDSTNFRLYGVTPPLQKNDPVVEMLLSRKQVGKEIRKALCKNTLKSRKQPKKVVRRAQKLTNDQKLFLRTHGTMGLGCLRAVHQAYGDRERAQQLATKAEQVAEMKEQRELVTMKVRNLKQDFQLNVLRNRIREGVRIADALRENEKKQETDRAKVSALRAAAVMKEQMRQAETTFLKEFASQQTSVSKALRSHDREELTKEKLAKNAETVRQERESCLEQQALVKKFMEHRQLVRQAETARAKAELDAKMLQEANRKFMEIQTLAKQTKNRVARVKEFYPLPRLNAPPIETPLSNLSPGKFSSWKPSVQKDSRYSFDDSISNSESCSLTVSQHLVS